MLANNITVFERDPGRDDARLCYSDGEVVLEKSRTAVIRKPPAPVIADRSETNFEVQIPPFWRLDDYWNGLELKNFTVFYKFSVEVSQMWQINGASSSWPAGLFSTVSSHERKTI